MSEITVSFIITVYNKSLYLLDVLSAVKEQNGTFSREYIIINDGSTDDSLEKIKQITEHWNNCRIFDQENSGVVKATLLGISHAKGEFIKFVDGDDLLLPDTTIQQLALLENNSDLAYAACSFSKKINGMVCIKKALKVLVNGF